jgi:chaperonin GroES
VVAVGSGRILDDGTVRAVTVKPGDRVLFGKYTGDEIKLDGTEHIILREEDVLAILDK